MWATVAWAVGFGDSDPGEFYALAEVEERAVVQAADSVVDLNLATGFLVTPHHVLTNHHVAERLGPAVRGWMSTSGRPVDLVLVATAPDQDVALYHTRAEGLVPLRVRVAPLAQEGEQVAVLGHPGGSPLRISFGPVLTADALVGGIPSVEYDAQTWWGSSGSPVVDREGRAVAVHWGWDSTGQYHGRPTGVPIARAVAALPELAEALLCPEPDELRLVSTPIGGEDDRRRFRLTVEGPPGCLQTVDEVVWHLHPTFEDPDVRARSLQVLVWGSFDLTATVTVAGAPRVLSGAVGW